MPSPITTDRAVAPGPGTRSDEGAAGRRPLLGVSTCILRGDAVLLVERGRPPFLGLLSLPGGRPRFGERLALAARREVMEETGLDIGEPPFLQLHEALGEDVHAVIAVHLVRLDPADVAVPVAGDDAAAAFFVPLSDLGRLESEARLTDGLRAIIMSAAAAT